jgi:hypothetical protein
VSEVDRILQTYHRSNDQASDAATAYRRGDNAGYYEAEAEGNLLEKQQQNWQKHTGSESAPSSGHDDPPVRLVLSVSRCWPQAWCSPILQRCLWLNRRT